MTGLERQMSDQNRIDVNRFWVCLIIIYFVTASMPVFARLIPHFLTIVGELVWIALCCFYYSRRKWNGWIGIGILGFLGLGLLFKLVPEAYETNFLLSETLLAFVFCLAEARDISIRDYCHIRRLRPPSVLAAIVAGLAVYVTAAFVNGVAELFSRNYVQGRFMTGEKEFLIGFLVFAILPAIMEEITYRGIIFRGIGASVKGLLVSSLMFGLMHMNFNQISYAVLMGIIFGMVLMITDNLLVTIILHMTFNGFTVFLAAFQETGVVRFFSNLNIAGYYLYAPDFRMENGGISWSLLLVGALFALIALGMTFLFAGMIRKLERSGESDLKAETDESQGGTWRPNAAFFTACAVCLLVAVLTELFVH